MNLSKSEVSAIIDYVFQHSRGNPNGKAFKVWQKMFDFLNDKQPNLYESTTPKVTHSHTRPIRKTG